MDVPRLLSFLFQAQVKDFFTTGACEFAGCRQAGAGGHGRKARALRAASALAGRGEHEEGSS